MESKLTDNIYIKILEMHIKKNFAEQLLNTPVNCMTPFVVEYEDTGKQEFIFVVNADDYLSEPLQGQSIDSKRQMGNFKMYMEEDSLVFGFEIEPDINLETVIQKDSIIDFLSGLHKQDIMTVVFVDPVMFNVIWLTNNFPWHKLRDNFNSYFEHFGIE